VKTPEFKTRKLLSAEKLRGRAVFSGKCFMGEPGGSFLLKQKLFQRSEIFLSGEFVARLIGKQD
jgi:hypothetical protein